MDFSNLKSKLLLTLVLSREMNNFNCCNYVHSLWDGVLSGKSISRRTRQAGGARFRSRVAYCEVSFCVWRTVKGASVFLAVCLKAFGLLAVNTLLVVYVVENLRRVGSYKMCRGRQIVFFGVCYYFWNR